MKIGDFHLTYCGNIHPGEHWPDVFSNLKNYIPLLKSQFAPHDSFGIGLRLANPASEELLQKNQLDLFKEWLNQNDLYVFTLNGFPYGEFHRRIVKETVYAPDWSTEKRLKYTIRLAKILAALLPEEMDGSISTSPISYKPWFKNSDDRHACLDQSCLHLIQMVMELINIENKSGKWIHLDLEPEPNGMLGNSTELIDFFQERLLPKGGTRLSSLLGISLTKAREFILRHIGLCYDTCHFAVSFENPTDVLERLRQAGIHIGKVQISAALKLKLRDSEESRQVALKRLKPFAESTYLHQVIEKKPDGSHHTYSDLTEALPSLQEASGNEWRIHFHVPVFVEDYQTVMSTQEDIKTLLRLLKENPFCPLLEIETYTWEVLPEEMKKDLSASIQREYDWVLKQF
ncbi:MAG: metabolite traffic protein EboE [SAR324 cluster bacterium]|nr:metabolite traffic protein EboE [SAR324 cluster bacterium]